jgi:hypothetical protein
MESDVVSVVDNGEETGKMTLIQEIAAVCGPFCETNATGWVPGTTHNHQLDPLLCTSSEPRDVIKRERMGFKRYGAIGKRETPIETFLVADPITILSELRPSRPTSKEA